MKFGDIAVKLISRVCTLADYIVAGLLDMVFPEKCRVCGEWLPVDRDRSLGLRALCCDCWQSIAQEACRVEWVSSSGGEPFQIVSRTEYRGVMKKLLYRFKYDGDQLLGFDLSILVRDGWTVLRREDSAGAVIVVPIPLHADRKESRGFNQSQLLAREVARAARGRMDVKALVRKKRTTPQHGLSRVDRRDNLSGAFRGNAKRLSGREVVLVDDVYTSGATLMEAAQTALACGATRVSAITLARALLSCNQPMSLEHTGRGHPRSARR